MSHVVLAPQEIEFKIIEGEMTSHRAPTMDTTYQ